MGTISDKLMRIINTKEDIRQALISKGYDVPTSIPFKEYAKMILDLPCNADSFPDIEGIVARYSASGLTNEQIKSLDTQADDEPQYPYPVYDSPSSEFESVLSSKEWVSDVNDERL